MRPWYFFQRTPQLPQAASPPQEEEEEEYFEPYQEQLELDLDEFLHELDWDDEPPKKKHPLAKRFILPDGSFEMECKDCHKRCQWAESNQDDGSFVCCQCRIGW